MRNTWKLKVIKYGNKALNRSKIVVSLNCLALIWHELGLIALKQQRQFFIFKHGFQDKIKTIRLETDLRTLVEIFYTCVQVKILHTSRLHEVYFTKKTFSHLANMSPNFFQNHIFNETLPLLRWFFLMIPVFKLFGVFFSVGWWFWVSSHWTSWLHGFKT